ncbi:hypothetical protein IFM89_037740 [Coptis chinensis]|uniref:RNase H type-1 domain-containing protein n=1 Tax=Coptis chinensis TaxID=261450 RepID=A0A835ITL0_9MAGN|nr:hypothetical protein IFM89_037740 [Coptis chinensis]
MGIIENVEVALSNGWDRLWIESDSRAAVMAFGTSKLPWKVRPKWERCKSRLSYVMVSSAWCEVNFAADQAARHSHSLTTENQVAVDYVVEALRSCHISDRQVCIKWWKLGRWLYGYRLRDECHTRKVSLADIVLAKEDEVLGVLQRGALHEVLRVQISVPGTYIPWTSQNVHTTG